MVDLTKAHRLHKVVIGAALGAQLIVTPGCATVRTHLPTVLAVIDDAQMVLDTVENFLRRYYSENTVNPETQVKVEGALVAARQSLSVALRTAHGAQKMSQDEIDAAFFEFKVAYKELMVLVGPFGVRSGDKMAVAPGMLTVPTPLALK